MTARTDVGTIDDLHASAVKACGLNDFGVDDDNYREALGVLLESFRRDADLTEFSSRMQRFFVRNASGGGRQAGVRGRVQAVSAARGREDRAADLRDRTATHGDHCHPPTAHRRPTA